MPCFEKAYGRVLLLVDGPHDEQGIPHNYRFILTLFRTSSMMSGDYWLRRKKSQLRFLQDAMLARRHIFAALTCEACFSFALLSTAFAAHSCQDFRRLITNIFCCKKRCDILSSLGHRPPLARRASAGHARRASALHSRAGVFFAFKMFTPMRR